MFDLIFLIKTFGYLGLFSVIFAESGLFIGFFFPGDSLLFTAGFLASQGVLHIGVLMALMVAAAIAGDSFGYAFGRKIGPLIFTREDSFFFHKDNLERARVFYETYGKKTIILARFMPGVRTFAPILAGVGTMEYGTFLSFNAIGGLVWGAGLPWLGYYLGSSIPNIDRYLIPIVLAIIVLSIAPTAVHILRDPGHRERLFKFLKSKVFFS
ncbi:MAG: VTT domain-containing protein [Patescibacteria group bacterium]|nr:VTT domain-containing protein [Patescibacteria group bacterium]